MTIVEIAAILVAVAFAALVGYLIPVLIQVRKTVAEYVDPGPEIDYEMNQDLPTLVAELRAMSQNLNDLASQARDGVQHAAVLLHAVGEVGESVQQVHNVVRGTSGNMLTNVASVVAGFRAATQVLRDRMKHEGGPHNGG